MDDPHSDATPNPFAAPSLSVETGPVIVPRATVWPTALGIIVIVLGAFGVLGGCLNFVTNLLVTSGTMGDMMARVDPTSAVTYDAMQAASTSLLGFAVMALLIAGWLISVGIGILKKRPWAPRMAWNWSIAKMLYVVAQCVFTARMQQVQFEVMAKQNRGPTPFDIEEMMAFFSYFGIAIAIVWGWALPVFLLVWFRREVVRLEVAQWRNTKPIDKDAAIDIPPFA